MPLPTNICVLYNLNGSSEFSLPLLSEQLVAHINMCGSMVNTFAVMSLCMERNESWGFLIALMAILMMAGAGHLGMCEPRLSRGIPL